MSISCSVLKVHKNTFNEEMRVERTQSSYFFIKEMAWWLSWLERRPVTAEVVGSSPIRVGQKQTKKLQKNWDLSSAGRASALQAEGHRFEPCRSHKEEKKLPRRIFNSSQTKSMI